jgi:glycerol-3-phosphate dehydrogenase subunit C
MNSQPFQLTPEQSLDQCIKCNICTASCPVYSVTDLFPGPKAIGPQAGRFRIPDGLSPDLSVDFCSGCRVCNMVCPNGVKIAEMNARARARMVEQGKIPLRKRIRNNLIARAENLGKIAQPVAPLANAILENKPIRHLLEKTFEIAEHAPLPSFAPYRFTRWYRSHQKPGNLFRKVVYFHGCSTEYYEPRIGQAAVYVLEKNGFEVIVPEQNCCGLPLLSNGEFQAARKYHQGNIRKLMPWIEQGVPVVGTSTSCILTLKEEAPELLEMWDEESIALAENTYDLNEFLLSLVEDGSFNRNLHPIPLQLPYHIPCQYRAHRLGSPGMDVLNLIPELTIFSSNEDCCGIAGTYGYKKEKYQISMDVGRNLFTFVSSFPAEYMVCDSETCRWQITRATGKPAIHPVELLAASYGYKDGRFMIGD